MYPKWLWPVFALPGVVWLILLFLVPFYAVIGVAFGGVDSIRVLAWPDRPQRHTWEPATTITRGAMPIGGSKFK